MPSEQDKKPVSMILLAILAGATMLTIVLFLVTKLVTVVGGRIFVDDSARQLVAAADRIKPVGTLVIRAVAATPATTETASTNSTTAATGIDANAGKAIYDGLCTACHAVGVSEAPRIDDPDNWKKRLADNGGFDGLLKLSISGINAMPARGGNPSLTDDEMKNAIAYMLKTAGLEDQIPK